LLVSVLKSAVETVHNSQLANPNHSDDNPTVAILRMTDDENEPFEILGEVGAVMTMDDGRIGIVVSNK